MMHVLFIKTRLNYADRTVSENSLPSNLIIKNLIKQAQQLEICNSKVHSLLQLCIACYLGHAHLKLQQSGLVAIG